MVGATSSSNGSVGYVNAVPPKDGYNTKYLRADGTWQVPPDHTYTVNNATLTIQKNGTTVKTFTANASSDVTCNITVPTKTSDLTNDSNFITEDTTKIPLSGTNALSGSIVPNTDNAYNLGDSSHNYASVYAYNFPTFMRAMSPSDDTDMFLIAGTDVFYGAYLQLSSKDTTSGSTAGEFRLSARSTNNQSDLIGTPDGTLTWGNKKVDTIEEQGEEYIRYSNGIQICWSYITAGATVTKNFPKSFSQPPNISLTSDTSNTDSRVTCQCTSQTVTAYRNFEYYGSFYIAIGRWK